MMYLLAAAAAAAEVAFRRPAAEAAAEAAAAGEVLAGQRLPPFSQPRELQAQPRPSTLNLHWVAMVRELSSAQLAAVLSAEGLGWLGSLRRRPVSWKARSRSGLKLRRPDRQHWVERD